MVLAGRVLMQLGSPEKAVSDTVKEVIRILKKTQPAQVSQVFRLLHTPAPCSASPVLQTSHSTIAMCQDAAAQCSGLGSGQEGARLQAR